MKLSEVTWPFDPKYYPPEHFDAVEVKGGETVPVERGIANVVRMMQTLPFVDRTYSSCQGTHQHDSAFCIAEIQFMFNEQDKGDVEEFVKKVHNVFPDLVSNIHCYKSGECHCSLQSSQVEHDESVMVDVNRDFIQALEQVLQDY